VPFGQLSVTVMLLTLRHAHLLHAGGASVDMARRAEHPEALTVLNREVPLTVIGVAAKLPCVHD